MKNRWLALAVGVALTLALIGCTTYYPDQHRGPHVVGYVAPAPGYVVVPVGHVHSASCGHYWDGHGWLVVSGHVHGPGCGHGFVGGQWILGAPAPQPEVVGGGSVTYGGPVGPGTSLYVTLPVGHVHSATCGHYWDGQGWLMVSGHVHGPGCGHAFVGGQWILSVGGPVGEGGGAEMYVNIPVGHVHSATCGHFWDGDRWYYTPGHVHGPGCGHGFTGGQWMISVGGGGRHHGGGAVLYATIPVGHVHSEHCGHYWDGTGWILVANHVHGPGCGHRFHNNQWTISFEFGR